MVADRRGGVRVKTTRDTYEAGRLILSAGAWISDLAPALKTTAVAERQVVGWFQPTDARLFMPDTFPVTILDVEEGAYYVLPVWSTPGVRSACTIIVASAVMSIRCRANPQLTTRRSCASVSPATRHSPTAR